MANLFESNARMDLVDGYREIILDALYGQILAHALELIANVSVVVLFPPFLFEQLERLLEDRQRPNGCRIW